jgi:hypothetical protein
MSAPSAGKFQDHYEVLGVEHKAGTDAIKVAYARLAEKFHPATGFTPDPEKYDAISLAFEVLCDPELRREFDKLKGIGGEEKPKFSGMPFFEAYGRDINLRVALLCVLYDRRRSKPFTPSLSMRHVESIVAATSEEINFALWYLKNRELVLQDDKSSLLISTEGMDYLKNNPPDAKDVLRYIRPESVADGGGLGAPRADSAVAEQAPVPPALEVLRVSNPAIDGTATRIGDFLARRRQN